MDSATFTKRLREVVNGGRPERQTVIAADATSGLLGTDTDLERVLGGSWRHSNGSSCFVVERKLGPAVRHGRDAIGSIASRLAEGAAEAALITTNGAVRPPFLFFDLETTGLSGGAGTHAFLVGCGRFDAAGAFETRQFLLTRYADERALLAAVSGELATAGALVTFNGKSFDAPVLETRYLFHRLEWTAASLPHMDVLHPARRFWGLQPSPEREPSTSSGSTRASSRVDSLRSSARDSEAQGASGGGAPRAVKNDCSLIALERQILGALRAGDVPGFEIPERYFRFVRSGDARPLVDVLEHNRLDLLSLAGLTARLLDLIRVGPEGACDACEMLALGATYARASLIPRAYKAYMKAVAASAQLPVVRIVALRALALLLRRLRQYDEAATFWQQLVAVRDCPAHIVCEANEALAIHHEHRVKDLPAAEAFALRSMDNAGQPRWTETGRYRLARIQKKMGKSEA